MKSLNSLVATILAAIGIQGGSAQAANLGIDDLIIAGDVVVLFAYDLFGGQARSQSLTAEEARRAVQNLGRSLTNEQEQDATQGTQQLVSLSIAVFGSADQQTVETIRKAIIEIRNKRSASLSDQEISEIGVRANIHNLPQERVNRAVRELAILANQ